MKIGSDDQRAQDILSTSSKGKAMNQVQILNIRRGKGERSKYIYAQLYVNGELSICATLDYIIDAIKVRKYILEGESNG